MQRLQEAVLEVQEKYPQIAGMGFYAGYEALCQDATTVHDQRSLDILVRAHMASRAGEFHDCSSTVVIKEDFRTKYNICPEW